MVPVEPVLELLCLVVNRLVGLLLLIILREKEEEEERLNNRGPDTYAISAPALNRILLCNVTSRDKMW